MSLSLTPPPPQLAPPDFDLDYGLNEDLKDYTTEVKDEPKIISNQYSLLHFVLG